MGVFTYECEHTTVIDSRTLFNAFVLDVDKHIASVAGNFIESTERIKGNGGPGTVKNITFAEGKLQY